MIFEVYGVSMVQVEIFYNALLTSPHVDIVLRIAKMGCQARSEVTCTEDDNF